MLPLLILLISFFIIFLVGLCFEVIGKGGLTLLPVMTSATGSVQRQVLTSSLGDLTMTS